MWFLFLIFATELFHYLIELQILITPNQLLLLLKKTYNF